MDFDESIVAEFIEESEEHLDGIEDDLLAIEQAGADVDPDVVNEVFRALHTIKGGAGFLALNVIKELAHHQEHLLNLIRKGELIPTPEIVNSLLNGIDKLRSLIADYANSNEEDVSDLVADLQRVANADSSADSVGSDEVQSLDSNASSNTSSNTSSNSDKNIVKIYNENNVELFTTDMSLIENERGKGHYLYILTADLTKATDENSDPNKVAEHWKGIGTVLKSSKKLNEGLCDDIQESQLPELHLFLATVLEPDMLNVMIEVPGQSLRHLDDDDFIAADDTAQNTVASTESVSKAPNVATPSLETKTEKPVSTPVEVKPAPVKVASAPVKAPVKNAEKATPPKKVDASIRVQLNTLNTLMTLAGELVLARNQLVQSVKSADMSTVEGVTQRVDTITSELQLAIMATRMQPIGNVFNKFKRVVRDLSRTLKKEIELEITGEDVELDKTIIEAIGDPLTHLIRNACDHGIELPAKRLAAGKPKSGRMALRAFYEAGQVIIQIEDNGNGIDATKVKAKALEGGAWTAEQLDAMPEKEIVKLIFNPGFSLAEKVTDVSGRGVGMDVVFQNLTKIGGVIDIDTEVGKGSIFTIKLPLTLAIMPSLLISLAKHNYAIPQVNLVELVRISPDKIQESIQTIGEAVILRLRDVLLPILRLSDVLGLESRSFFDPETGIERPCRRDAIADRRSNESAKQKAKNDENRLSTDRRSIINSSMNIVVVNQGGFHYGLIVDDFLDSEEIVVKPLGKHLQDCKCYAGATIQGDGSVALILDVVGISDHMNLGALQDANSNVDEVVDDSLEEDHSLLLVKNHKDEQFAVPLSLIERIEKIKNEDIVEAGGRSSIQYRGGSLALFSIEEVAQVKPRSTDGDIYVLVFEVAKREVGVLVSDVVDVLDYKGEIDESTFSQKCIFGSGIMNNVTTLLLDLQGIIQESCPEWFVKLDAKTSESIDGSNGKTTRSKKILVVDDSKFYRNQISRFITETGCEVVTAEDGAQALELVENSLDDPFGVVFTDIEMPVMDGLEFTRKVRANPHFSDLPMVAITSVAGSTGEKAGFEAGVDRYLIKLDKNSIVEALENYVF